MKDIDLLESLERATRNQVDTKTFMQANMIVIHEWNKRPIRRFINFMKRIRNLCST